MKNLLGLVLLLLPLAHAQNEDAMQVEIMIVRYSKSLYEMKRYQDNEDWGVEPATLEEAAMDLSLGDHSEIFPIQSGALLGDKARTLEKSDTFDVLYHGGWQQPLMAPGQARLIRFINELQNGLLAGNARISYDDQFLLQLSLLYDINFYIGPVEQAAPQNRSIVINFKEVLENEKSYYFDHPAIGILVSVRKI